MDATYTRDISPQQKLCFFGFASKACANLEMRKTPRPYVTRIPPTIPPPPAGRAARLRKSASIARPQPPPRLAYHTPAHRLTLRLCRIATRLDCITGGGSACFALCAKQWRRRA